MNMGDQISKRYTIAHMAAERGGYELRPSTRRARATTHGYFADTDMYDYWMKPATRMHHNSYSNVPVRRLIQLGPFLVNYAQYTTHPLMGLQFSP